MPKSKLGDVLQYLRTVFQDPAARDLTDAELLQRFLTQHEETAFSLLVQRHGPMVLGVCRRLLRDSHSAEDSLQATFVVLVRRAASIRATRSLASWLHGVAHRIALKARAQTMVRQSRERPLEDMPGAEPHDDMGWQELRIVLDEEIGRLAEKYRAPIVLCYFEDKSYDQAAKELGWSKSSLAKRLTRARELLRQQLVRRGIALSAGVLATVLGAKVAGASLPALLTIKTVKAAASVVGGKALAGGCLSTGALALAEEAIISMAAIKGKLVLLVLALGLAIGGAGWAGYSRFGEKSQPAPAAQEQPPAAKELAGGAAKKDMPVATDAFGDPLPEGAMARFGTVRFRDLAQPTPQLAYAAGGKVLISSGAQFFGICAWDADSGRPLYQLRAPRIPMSLAVSPDGKSLFSEGGDLGIFLGLDVATGKELRQFPPGASGQGAFSPDGRTVAVAQREDWEVIRWDFTTGKVLPRLGRKNEIGSAVAFAPDGEALATASRDNSIRLWNGATGKEVRRFVGHEKLVCSLAFAPDGKVLASAGEGSLIRLWDVDTGKTVQMLTGSEGYNSTVVFSPDGRYLASSGGSGELRRGRIGSRTLRLWDAKTGKELHRWESISAMAFSPDGKVLATVAQDRVIRRWDPGTGKEIDPPTGHVGPVDSLRFTPGGKTLISHARFGTVVEWDLGTLTERRSLFSKSPPAPAAAEWTVADVSPDGKVLALVDWGNSEPETIRLWDARAGREFRALTLDKGGMFRPYACLFSPDGRILATQDKSGVRLWNVTSGKVIHDLPAPPGGGLAFSPDGARVATVGSSDHTMRLWDMATGKETRRWHSRHDPWRLLFLPDGKRLVSADGESLRVWAVDTGKEIQHLAAGIGHTLGEPLAVSPSGRVLAAGRRRQWTSEDNFLESGAIRLWDLFSGEEIRQFDVPQGDVSSLAFTPDGRKLASGGWDSTILMWDMTSQPGNDKLRPGLLTAGELDELWSDLAGDASKAERALWRLVRAPTHSPPLFKDRLRSVASQPALVNKVLADLDSEQFAMRQKATKALDELGEAAEGAVHKTLDSNPTLETRKRLEQFLEKRKKEMIRKLRAIDALEQIGTPEARQLLQKLTHEAPNPRVVQAASRALDRLATRASPIP